MHTSARHSHGGQPHHTTVSSFWPIPPPIKMAAPNNGGIARRPHPDRPPTPRRFVERGSVHKRSKLPHRRQPHHATARPNHLPTCHPTTNTAHSGATTPTHRGSCPAREPKSQMRHSRQSAPEEVPHPLHLRRAPLLEMLPTPPHLYTQLEARRMVDH